MKADAVQLLVSVKAASEVEAAINGGADVIDIKDPGRGPLGMPPIQTVDAVLQRVAERRRVSLALGELQELPSAVPAGLAFVKVGLAGAPVNWQPQLFNAIDAYKPARLVAVGYADGPLVAAPTPVDVANWVCQYRVSGLLIDTAVKDGRDLFDWLDEAQLELIIAQVQSAGLMVALAGALRESSFERAVYLCPNIVAVRGAACAGDQRKGRVDQRRVQHLAQVVAARNERRVSGCG